MIAETTVTQSDNVFVRHTAGGPGEDPGNVRNDDAGGSATQLPNAIFLTTSSSADQPVILEVNMSLRKGKRGELTMTIRLPEAVVARFDANETAFLERQLEDIQSETFDVLYPTLKARQLIPVRNDANRGARFITYRQFDRLGMAKIMANEGDDIPYVDVIANEFTVPVRELAAAYKWTLNDLEAAIMTGNQLDARRAQAARDAVERKLDDIGAFGDQITGLGGLLNNSNVPLVAPDTGNWAAATAEQVLQDMHKLANSIPILTNEVHAPNTLLLDVDT